MPRGRAGTCAICDHEAREAIDALLMASAPYRSISRKHGVSTRALSEHRQKDHHTEPSDISPEPETTDGREEWIHVAHLERILAILREELLDAQRVRIADRLKDLEARATIVHVLNADLTPEQIEEARHLNSGRACVMSREGGQWRAQWMTQRQISERAHAALATETSS